MKDDEITRLFDNGNTIKSIAEKYNIPYKTIWWRLKKSGKDTSRKPKLFKNNPFLEYTDYSCYWAGFILGKGSIRAKNGTYSLSIDFNKNHLNKLNSKLENQAQLLDNSIKIYSKDFIKTLKNSFGITANKNPNKYLEKIPEKFLPHFVRGYFDARGYISYQSGTIIYFHLSFTNIETAKWFVKIFKKNNLINGEHLYRKQKSIVFELNSKNGFKILDWIYLIPSIKFEDKFKEYLLYKSLSQKILDTYKQSSRRIPSGCKGFDLDYKKISQEYLNGKTLKDLSNRYKISEFTLIYNFKKHNIRKTTKRFHDIQNFSKFSSDTCYWAGFLAADGWVNNYTINVELSQKDKNHLLKLKSFLNSTADIIDVKKVKNGKIYKYSKIHFNSVKLAEILKSKYNIIQTKSLILKPPKIPEQFIRDYIRGYIDGDGSLGWNKSNKRPRVSVCSGSYRIVEWIKCNIEKFNNTGSPSIIQLDDNLYSVTYDGLQTYEIMDWLYESATTYLDRKYARYSKYIKSYKKHINETIRKLEPICELYKSKKNNKEIANITNIPQHSVNYYLTILGLKNDKRYNIEVVKRYINKNIHQLEA